MRIPYSWMFLLLAISGGEAQSLDLSPPPAAPQQAVSMSQAAAAVQAQLQQTHPPQQQSRSTTSTDAAGPASVLTLDQAIAIAQSNEPQFAAATAERRALALERTNAKTALLPSLTYHNAAIYTQPNGVATSRIGQVTGADSPIFIANNAIREYTSQGVFDEKIGLAQIAAIHSATANALRAEAEAEVARRGLVVTVTTLFFSVQATTDKLNNTIIALHEADHFLYNTQQREAAGDAAHADVLKAQLAQQGRARELAEARLQASKAHLELGVLLYPDPATPYTVDIPIVPPALPARIAIDTLARDNNPEIRSALASLQVAQAGTFTSKAALAPDLALNYTYGIDATNFGKQGPDGINNLGYSMSATLDIPVWNWLATERTVKASKLREGAAKVALTAAQRRLLADLQEFYDEAALASQQLQSLDASVLTARESLRLTNLRYTAGESTALEVVDAQNALTTAETAQVDGQLRYQIARAQLQTLTGRLP